MALPQFYIPGEKSRAAIDARILGFGVENADAGSQFRAGVCDGPDGKTGFILCLTTGNNDALPKCGYFPDLQTWHECEGGKYWIGIETDRPPTPDELQRPTSVFGYPTELSDGNQWHVPIARSYPTGTTLPESIDLDPDGKPIFVVMPRFQALSLSAEGVYAQFMETQTFEAETWDVLVNLATDALCVNYFGGKWLFAKAMGLFTKPNVTQILFGLIDGPQIQEYLVQLADDKKKAPDSSEPLDGQTDTEPTTPTQDSETCGSTIESTRE